MKKYKTAQKKREICKIRHIANFINLRNFINFAKTRNRDKTTERQNTSPNRPRVEKHESGLARWLVPQEHGQVAVVVPRDPTRADARTGKHGNHRKSD